MQKYLHADCSLFLTLNQHPHSFVCLQSRLGDEMRVQMLRRGWAKGGGQRIPCTSPCRDEEWGPSCVAGARECFGTGPPTCAVFSVSAPATALHPASHATSSVVNTTRKHTLLKVTLACCCPFLRPEFEYWGSVLRLFCFRSQRYFYFNFVMI